MREPAPLVRVLKQPAASGSVREAMESASDPPGRPADAVGGGLPARIPGALVAIANEHSPRPRQRIVPGASVRVNPQPVEIGGEAEPSAPTPPLPSVPDEPPAETDGGSASVTEAELNAAIGAARAEAYARGRADAEAELRTEFETHKAAFAADVDRLEAAWRTYHDRLERQLVTLAVEAAELLVDGPLPDAIKEIADRALAQATERLARGDGLTIRIHPVDYLRLEEAGLVAGLTGAHPDLVWTPDDALPEGDWTVESAEAAVRNVRAELLDGLRARLDLHRAIQEAPLAAPLPQPQHSPPSPPSGLEAPPAGQADASAGLHPGEEG